jgi:hypothetical protein
MLSVLSYAQCFFISNSMLSGNKQSGVVLSAMAPFGFLWPVP